MSEFVLITFLIAAVGFIGYPFFKPARTRASQSRFDGRLDDLEAKKLSLIAAIKEIEFDFQMGKLSEKDFDDMSVRYRVETMALMQRIEQLKSTEESQDIEAEIRRYRQDKRSVRASRR